MKVAGLILGIVGSLAGFAGSLFALSVGGLGAAFEAQGAAEVVGLGWGAVVFSLIGIIGAALSMVKPKLSGWMMIVAAIGGVICVSMGYIVAAPLLLVGGLLALLGAKEDKKVEEKL